MIEQMDMLWVWGILGLVLLGVEMLTGTLYILWFAVAAFLLSVLTWLYPTLSITLQLFAYAVLALGSLFIYRHFYNKNDPNLKIGQAQGDEIGTVGQVIQTITPQQSGKIQFAQGVMGSREWVAVSDETINQGELAVIVVIEGNTLRVKAQIV